MRGWRDCNVIIYCFPQRVLLLYIVYSVHKRLGNSVFFFSTCDSSPYDESGLVAAMRITSCIRSRFFFLLKREILHFFSYLSALAYPFSFLRRHRFAVVPHRFVPLSSLIFLVSRLFFFFFFFASEEVARVTVASMYDSSASHCRYMYGTMLQCPTPPRFGSLLHTLVLLRRLSASQDHYTAMQPGLQRMVLRLEELVQRIDGEGIF